MDDDILRVCRTAGFFEASIITSQHIQMVSRDVLMRKRKTAEIINVAFIKKRKCAEESPKLCQFTEERWSGQIAVRY